MNLSHGIRQIRMKYNIVFVFLISTTLISSVESFTSPPATRRSVFQNLPKKGPRSTISENDVPPASSTDNSYQSDLIRTLSKGLNIPGNPMQRTARPYLLREDVDGAQRAVRMLRHMVRLGVATTESFELVFKAILKRGRIQWMNSADTLTCAANELEFLLDDLEEFSEEQDETVSTEFYNIVLEAYANCANSRSKFRYAEKAEELIARIDADAASILHVLRAWAWQQGNRESPECADKANKYLQLLFEKSSDNKLLAEGCDAVIEAYSKAIGGAASANVAYKRRLQIHDIPLPIADYTNIILAWSKDKSEDSLMKATSLLEEMSQRFLDGEIKEDPEHIAYNSVIAAWNKANQPEKAEELLWLMEKEVRPKAKTLKPDYMTYNSVCDAYIKDNSMITTQSLQAVGRIVKYMEENSNEQPKIKPDSYTYNTLLKAWNLSGNLNCADELVGILDRIESSIDKGMITNKNFNVLINSYAKSKDPDACSKVLNLLERMKKSKLVYPDTITYTTAIECLTKTGSDGNPDFSADKALELLSDIKSEYKATKKKDIMPNSRTYGLVILALTYSSRKDKMSLARGLLDELIEFYETTKEMALTPTVHPYNYIINCAAKMKDTTGLEDKTARMEAFKIAAKTYQDLRDHRTLKPDSFTYNFWLKTCDELLPSESDLYQKFMKLSFKQCCKEGLLSPQVLLRIQRSQLTWDQKGDLLQCNPREVRYVNLDRIPLSWSRNTKRH